jgi:thiol-disulfide isomerase/thioredoxin
MEEAWMAWTRSIAAAAGLIVLTGCNNTPVESAKSAPKKPEPLVMPVERKADSDTVATTPPPTPEGIASAPPAITAEKSLATPASHFAELTDIDIAGLQKFVADHKGKSVVVDNWATWCIPCQEKFPKFAALSKKLAGDKLVFITISYDEDEDQIDAAKEFLAKPQNQGNSTHLRMTDDLATVCEKFDFDGLPRYFLFDADGKLTLNTDDVAAVEEALKK